MDQKNLILHDFLKCTQLFAVINAGLNSPVWMDKYPIIMLPSNFQLRIKNSFRIVEIKCSARLSVKNFIHLIGSTDFLVALNLPQQI